MLAITRPRMSQTPGRANSHYLVAAVARSAIPLVLAVYLPTLQVPFGTTALDASELGVVMGLALLPTVLVEAAKALLRRFAAGWAESVLRAPR
jgi:hypothetical protein